MSKLLLLDGNSIVNRAFYAMPNLTSNSGVCTGGIFGFLKMLSKILKEEQPTHVAVAFDLKAPTFRHKQYKDYKAGRKPMPQELVQQIPILKDILKAMNIAYLELEGYEADDILGTLSKEFQDSVIIVSGDKDILQLADDHCTVYHTKKGISEVVKYTPALLFEEGISKPAYITDLKGLMGDASDNLKGVQGVGKVIASNLISQYGSLENLYDHIDEIKGKLREKLIEGKEDAYTSRTLATIFREVPLKYSIDDLIFEYLLPETALRKMIELNFKNVEDMFSFQSEEKKSSFEEYFLSSADEMREKLEQAKCTKSLCFNIDSYISFTVDGKTEYKVKPLESLLDETVPYETALDLIGECVNDDMIENITVFDLKSVYHLLIDHSPTFKANDLLLLSYVADITKHSTNLKDLLDNYGLDTNMPCCSILKLFDELKDKTLSEKTYKVYQNIELPLVKVLFDMEIIGFKVDTDVIENLNQKYAVKIDEISSQIYELAEGKFNINSPKQLGEILFDKLGLPSGKKKSTSAEVLEKFALIHPIIPLILEYRKISKLQSTYILGMKKLLDENNRLHTVFKQALTTTGRLSSTEPNLQNIPVRTQEGREIRKAFIAGEGRKLVVADYSQIELRLMAHISGDEHLISDFNSKKDVHSATASKVFGVPVEEVTHDMRRNAKAVNFGIIYGISDFGLSESIGCSVLQARSFIEKYFEGYPQIKEYMDNTVKSAKENGYVETLSGRKRIIPELKSPVYTIRTFGERAAMNMPLQGTASDIIKLAMINVFNEISKMKDTALILQVHDELIIDCPEDKAETVAKIVRECMENVFDLKVPLIAEVGIGDNWLEAKD